MNRNLWLCLCLMFAVYNLTLLVQDRNSVRFFAVDEWNEYHDNHTNFLICFRSEEIHGPASWPKLNLSEHLRKWKLNLSDQLKTWKLSDHLAKSVQLLNLKLNSGDFFRLNQSYLFGTESCFLFEKSKLEQLLSAGAFVSKFKTVLFAFSDGSLPLWADSIYTKFFGNDLMIKLQKQKVFGEAHLERNCLGHRNQLAANRYNCLNECHKKKRTRNCLYSFGELPNLRYGDLNWANETHEQFCLENCPDNECFYEDYEVVEMRKEYYERHLAPKREKVELKATTYRAQYAITDFYLQFFGLLTLFTGTSLISLLTVLIKKLRSSIKNETKKRFHLNRFFSAFKFVCVLVFLLFSFYKILLMVQDFKSQLNYPSKVITLNSKFETQSLSLFICFPIDTLIVKDNRFNHTRNLELSKKFSFQKLKEKTNLMGGIKKLFWVFINFGGRRKQRNSLIPDDALFKNSNEGNRSYLSRCFRQEITTDEHRYKRMIPIQQLVIEFSNVHWEVYLVENSQPFTSDLTRLRGEFRIAKFKQQNTRSSKKANCLNYKQAENCSTRQHCVDSCVSRKFYQKHRSLTVHSVLNENQLNKSAFFNLTRDRAIESDCLKRFERKDCDITQFDESSKTTYAANGHSLSLNLNFEVVTEREIEASPFKAVLDILNLLGILFGTNAPGLFTLLLLFLKKLASFERNKVSKFLFIFFCLLGFSAYSYLIFREIIQNDLFESAYFEKIKEFKVPNLIFCLELDEKQIDQNFALTAQYLDQLTNDLSYENFFNSIDYYDEKDAHRYFRPTNSNHSNPLFDFRRFYFLGLKCFQIAYKMTYVEDEFLTKPGRYVYFVYLNASSCKEYVYVSTKQSDSKEFSPFSKLKIRGSGRKGAYFYRYRMKFEVSELIVEDQFELLKNPLSLFYEKSDINDPTKYLMKMEKKFEQNYRVATREILLEDDNDSFRLRIEDELFEQFFLQVQNISDHLPSSLNTK